ncbi:hypothetical protein B0H34DRAFT_541279 [Crassisporium funariophilum]|nr:hypothetical protein B0H34DRAFT_541279 [Crassisporium funariophilum]
MSGICFDIIANDKWDNLASAEEIIQRCKEANAVNFKVNLRGVALVDGAKDNIPYAWVKYGRSVSMSEARTQHYVAEAVNSIVAAPVRIPAVYCSFRANGKGYIVMEYIEGEICSDKDATLVAAAVQCLITIRAPTEQPGPIGGGPICHDFFPDRESSATYSSVALLEKHINGILKHEGRPDCVRLMPEFQMCGLRLCLSDMNRANFMKDREGKIVALDFGVTCFLPVSFFELALCNSDSFTQRLRSLIVCPITSQLDALMTARYALVPFGTDKIGLPKELRAAAA